MTHNRLFVSVMVSALSVIFMFFDNEGERVSPLQKAGFYTLCLFFMISGPDSGPFPD
jgi:hypothetical protein